MPRFPRLSRRRGRVLLVGGILAAVTLTPVLPAIGEDDQADKGAVADILDGVEDFVWSFQGEGDDRVHSADYRTGSIAPSLTQKQLAARLGADTVRWNEFGTPRVLMDTRGYLSAKRGGSAVSAARAFVAKHRSLFRLTPKALGDLELLVDSPLYDSPDHGRVGNGQEPLNPDVAHVVTFRQTWGGYEAAQDGLLTVGVMADGRIAYVTSSVSGAALSGRQVLSATQAITRAADNVGLDLGELLPDVVQGPWQTFSAALSNDLQRARLLAMPTPRDGVRLVWETTLLRSEHSDIRDATFGQPAAFISFVDAETGRILLRDNRVDHLAEGATPASINLPSTVSRAPSATVFNGATDDAGACTAPAPHGPYAVPAGSTQIVVAAAALVPNGTDDDITINLYMDGQTGPVASGDLLTSPETLTYAPAGGVPAGDYRVEICEFAPKAGSITYTGTLVTSDVETGVGGSVVPRWNVFPANPNFSDGPGASQDTRVMWCWQVVEGCTGSQTNIASRLPWDALLNGASTMTTLGNNASTAISEVSFLTPDTVVRRPVSPTRDYDYAWDNTWFESSCNPLEFDLPGSNDADASTTNLFAMHNRMHDWSYYLGFTETNSNLQTNNFGNTPVTRENDPELGSSQAGRRTFNGRDNANQITLQDGIPGITNQYLWQPLAGSFYAACTDGAYDMAVVAHEYGHAISNRMVAGPDVGTGTTQGQTESWSDLIFAEYFRGFGISTGKGASSLALAPYVSGNKQRGIRNYSMDTSPLNYSNLGYDGNGATSPHSDGEIWSATNQDIVEAMNIKFRKRYSPSNLRLQGRCARGKLAAYECPGNRRWAQLMFDGLLLTPTSATMLDSRDAIIAADKLRFDGRNQKLLWRVFAKQGMGFTSSAKSDTDSDPIIGWTSPLEKKRAATVVFKSKAKNTQLFVGMYEARTTAAADTIKKTKLKSTTRFEPGRYQFLATAPGYGAVRFTRTLKPGKKVVVQVPVRRNVASASSGATATGDGVNVAKLIDDTEGTNWASVESAGTASEGKGEGKQVEGRQVTVKLKKATRISTAQVSAALRPQDEADADPAAQSRFSALRSFDILVCDATKGSCATDARFKVAYKSRNDAFPGVRPRPAAPDLLLRSFSFKPVRATHVRIVVRASQCTGGPLFQAAANPSNDPIFSNPDCDSEDATPDRLVLTPPVEQVRIAELQVFAAPAKKKRR